MTNLRTTRARLVDGARRVRAAALVAACTLVVLVGCGFGALHLLREPQLSARLAAQAVGSVGHLQLVKSVQVVGRQAPFSSVCLPGQEPHNSVVRLETGARITVTPGRVVTGTIQRRHDLLLVESILAGCPRVLERLIFSRVAVRFEHNEPIGLRRVWLSGRRAFELRFSRGRLKIAVVFVTATMRPAAIFVRRGPISGWSIVQPLAFGAGRFVAGAQSE